MNILVVNWQDWKNPYAGGAEVYLYEIFSRMIKRGHSVKLLVSRAPGQSRHEIIDGFDIYRIGRRENFNFFVPGALRSLSRHYDIDVVIDDLNKIPFYSPLFTRKKVVPMLMHLFRNSIFKETNFIFASYVFLSENIIRFCYPDSNFVSISESTAEDLRRIGVTADIDVVHCGIPPKPGLTGIKRRKNLIAYVGRVKKYKSIDHFVKAVAKISRMRDIDAMIVGDGDARDELMDLSNTLNADIEFTGFVSEEEKYRIYSSARLIVQPSIKEGWGLTAIEAQSCGTPVVCADSPGLREVVVDGSGGYLYPYGDIDNFVSRIMELIDSDKTWKQFSHAAQKWARKFSWDNAAVKLERILRRVNRGNN
jgi:glycosyltransferase involved in cell wall biosynthesis